MSLEYDLEDNGELDATADNIEELSEAEDVKSPRAAKRQKISSAKVNTTGILHPTKANVMIWFADVRVLIDEAVLTLNSRKGCDTQICLSLNEPHGFGLGVALFWHCNFFEFYSWPNIHIVI